MITSASTPSSASLVLLYRAADRRNPSYPAKLNQHSYSTTLYGLECGRVNERLLSVLAISMEARP